MTGRAEHPGLLAHLVAAACETQDCPDVGHWWPRHRALAKAWAAPIDLAIAAGFSADRIAWAFASGYQAALRALLPDLPPDLVAAFCVTEAEGNRPKDIRTTLERDGEDGWRLSGAKRWTTLGPSGGLFLVAARDASVSGERPALRMVRVASDAPGVTVDTMPPTRFVPEVPHASLRFEGVALAPSALLPGDGYARYVKPFRTVEDIHVFAAKLAYTLREARRLGWPQGWIEGALAVLASMRALAAEPADAPATHVALAGALTQGAALFRDADGHWQGASDADARARWARDRELGGVAGKARALRTQRAWETLRG